MAYSKKVKQRALKLHNNDDTLSAEKITEILCKEFPNELYTDIFSPRTVRLWLAKEKKKNYNKELLDKHFTDLIEVAKILANSMEELRHFGEFLESETPFGLSDVGIKGNIINGGQVGIGDIHGKVDPWYGYGNDPEGTIDIKPVDTLLATCLFEHFKFRFPEFASYVDWHKADYGYMKGEIINKLKLLIYSRSFDICPSCPVCHELLS